MPDAGRPPDTAEIVSRHPVGPATPGHMPGKEQTRTYGASPWSKIDRIPRSEPDPAMEAAGDYQERLHWHRGAAALACCVRIHSTLS